MPGGGVTLLDASNKLSFNNAGEKVLMKAIKAPFKIILQNAGIDSLEIEGFSGKGVDVTNGNVVNMIKAGIIDPALVTKTALKNAISVATTIISADAVISNKRIEQ